jgi:hypothetical protein
LDSKRKWEYSTPDHSPYTTSLLDDRLDEQLLPIATSLREAGGSEWYHILDMISCYVLLRVIQPVQNKEKREKRYSSVFVQNWDSSCRKLFSDADRIRFASSLMVARG